MKEENYDLLIYYCYLIVGKPDKQLIKGRFVPQIMHKLTYVCINARKGRI